MKSIALTVAACAALAATAASGNANAGLPFKSARAAYSAFTSTTNVALRAAAYKHVKADIAARQGAAACDALGWLRKMARSLGKPGEDCFPECETLAASTNTAVRMAALAWMCDVAKGWEADRAAALVDGWLARVGGDVAASAFLLCRRMEMRRKAGDMSGADDAAAAVMSFGAKAPWAHYSQACFFRAGTLARRGDVLAAEDMLARLLDRDEVASPGVARRILSIGAGRELVQRFIDAMRERVSGVPFGEVAAFKARAQTAGAEVVELLVHLGLLDEALGECRVMLLTAGAPSSYGGAVRLTADVLKRIDGNLGRASAFLEAQKTNHVAAAVAPVPAHPQLSDPVRRAEREKCLAYARENASDWNAQLLCAHRLLWADCAEDSIRVALDAFAVAPFAEKSLQMCANAAMHPVSVITRDPAKVAAVRDYLLYGGSGRDGVAGTGDDLPHPVELYRSCVRGATAGTR